MTDATTTTGAPIAPNLRRSWIALAVLITGAGMALLDTTIVNVALPTIRTSLDASEATLAWIISGYALAYGLALIPAGRLGDRVGHKWVFIVGLTGFTIASLACGLSQDSGSLIAARIAQGLAGGIFFPAVTALIQLMFPPQVRGKAFAVFGATLGFSAAFGPIVGGVLIELLGEVDGWRSIFFVNLPFGVVAVVAAFLLLPRRDPSVARPPAGVDVVGLILLSGGLVAVLVPLIQGEDAGWPLWTYLSLIGGVVLIVVFALWIVFLDRRGSSPLVPPRLFRHFQFSGGTLLAFFYFGAFTSIFFTISIFWQAGLGHTALESGLVGVPFAVGSIVGATQSDRLARRLGRTVLAMGTGMVAVGLIVIWLMLWLVPATEITNWLLLAPLLLAGLGSGLFIAPNAQFIVATVDRADAGAASGVVSTIQRIGAAVGIAVIGTILFGTLEITPSVPGPPSAADVANGFAAASTLAMATSAALAVVAFALVFVLPKTVTTAGGPRVHTE